VNDRVAVIIPGCNERFMQATIDSLLAGAAGEVEIYAVVDGGPDNPIRPDPRVRGVRNRETVGMRESVNRIAPTLSARYLMKCDAHCLFAPGWDAALKAGCDDDWVAVPARHSIDPKTWTVCGRGGRALDLEWGGIAYHYVTFPYAPSMYGYGIHGREVPRDLNKALNVERQHLPVDDLMSFQGSCWFTTTANFPRLGPLDHAHTAEVSLADALAGATVQLTTLDGRLLSIPIPEIVYPGYVKVVHGEGMPSTKTGGGSAPVARGDLRLTLRVRFPQELSAQQKKDMRTALAGC